MRPSQIIDGLGLGQVTQNQWQIQEVSAKTGVGLNDGINKLLQMIKDCQKKSPGKYINRRLSKSIKRR